VPTLRLSAVFDSVCHQMGSKFVFSKVGDDYTSTQVKECLELLKMAGIIIPVVHTSANGVPLGAEINIKKQKMLLLDTGIFQSILGLNFSDILFENDFNVVNKGHIAEMFVGLEIVKHSDNTDSVPLYYWLREAKNSNAEVDYIISKNSKILPIEVKSGHKGSMQSMQQFLLEKNCSQGIRTSLENFSQYINSENKTIKVYPLYAMSEIIKE
jgi:predicted AAA+ superfamily ATPase